MLEMYRHEHKWTAVEDGEYLFFKQCILEKVRTAILSAVKHTFSEQSSSTANVLSKPHLNN